MFLKIRQARGLGGTRKLESPGLWEWTKDSRTGTLERERRQREQDQPRSKGQREQDQGQSLQNPPWQYSVPGGQGSPGSSF